MKSQTPQRHKLILVSNRLPVTIHHEGNCWQFKASSGGLQSALSSFHQTWDTVWVGWPGVVDPKDEAEVQEALAKSNYIPVFMPEGLVRRYYDGFSNNTIWPLLHSFPGSAHYSDEDWDAYKKVNMMFCDVLVKLFQPGDHIWVHDYHLMLLPKMIRLRSPEAAVGFFLHIPFPHYDIFRLLPWSREIVDGLLYSNLIGMHTYDYTQNFLSTVRRLLGYDNQLGLVFTQDRVVQVDVFPIGIDYKKFATAVETVPKVQEEIEKIRKRVGDRRIIFSVSRLDYTKGIPESLKGYEMFLKNYSEWKGKLVYVLVVVPSRQTVSKYASLKKEIDETVGRINSQLGTLEWVPIVYLYQSLNFEELVALYYCADVALIVPLRDGMNLVAKEYVASKSNEKGVLILSEMAGCAKELVEAISVNPNSVAEIAEAINTAITMPEEEQKRKNALMRARLEYYDTERWGKEFIAKLQAAYAQQETLGIKILHQNERQSILKAAHEAKRRLFLLDYDGTLVPFVREPSLAFPSTKVIEVLKKLTSLPNTEVVVLSSRDRFSLHTFLNKVPGLTLAAESGAWEKRKESQEWKCSIPELIGETNDWKKQILPILQMFVDRIPGSSIEELDFQLVWHYRKAERDIAATASKELNDTLINLTANLSITVLLGNKAIRIRNHLISPSNYYARSLAKEGWDFILALGEDYNELFSKLPPNSYTVQVGNKISGAKYNIRSVGEVIMFLEEFAQTMEQNV